MNGYLKYFIDWVELEHAHGQVEDVPDPFQKLRSANIKRVTKREISFHFQTIKTGETNDR